MHTHQRTFGGMRASGMGAVSASLLLRFALFVLAHRAP